MEKIKNAKVKIEKVGRIWVHATNPEYNNKAVKIQINEFFTKDFAKENIGKEVELTCKVIIEEGYMGYNVIMYPILKSQQEELEIISAYEFIKENLHWTKKSAEDGKFYITPKVKEKMEMLKGTYKEEIEIILSEYKKIAEENAPFYYNFYPDIYLSKDECQKYIGEVVEINGRYGIVKKAYCYKIQGEEECRHPWASEYTVEMKCEPIPETDDRVIEYKIEKEKRQLEIEKENEYKQEVNSFIQEFKKEFSEEKSIEFSDEEKKLIEAGKQIKIQGEKIWLTSSDGILHGGGKFLKITENSIWVVTNNGGDGDMWDLNFIYTGGAGGYGYKIQKTERRMEMIKKFKELKITL